jgi:DNA-binding transcriptional ArsR family regulator
MPAQDASSVADAREARDVIAFGQEIGRVLSDGRIVGRAEPFAKVFPSSRAVKRAVGLMACAVLEDIALDARIDDERGRLVAETTVRRIATNLGLNKDTVTKYLGRLREHGFVLQEESREVAYGRYEPCRYVLHPSAGIERFTVTPPEPRPGERQNPRSEPCPKTSDTVVEPVSDTTGHGDTGQGGFGRHERHVVGSTTCWPCRRSGWQRHRRIARSA